MEIKLFAFAALMAASVLTACGGTGKSVAGYGAQHEWYDDDNGETEKTLGLRNFNGIKSSMCVDVRYTQGSGYKVVARGTSRALSFADISVEDGLIYVRWKDSFSGTYRTGVDERITLFVTAPKFEKFESNGSMTFTTGTYKVDELYIDNKGGFDLKCGDIIGKSAGAKATISSGGRITITAGRISLGGLDISSSGALELSNEGLTAHDVKFSNYGRMTYSGDVKAGNVVVESSGASDITAGFDVSGNYTFKNSGGMTFNGNISAKVVVCFPESCASEITAVFNPKPGSTRFSNEDFPTPDKPATAVTFPANSAFTSSTPSPVSADTAKQTYPTCS